MFARDGRGSRCAQTRPTAYSRSQGQLEAKGRRVMLTAGRSGRGLLLLAAALLAGTVPSALAADGTSADAIPPAVSQFLQSLTRTGVVAPTTGATPAIGKAQP